MRISTTTTASTPRAAPSTFARRPCPPSKAKRAQAAALRAHRVLGCRAYSRTDVILGKNGRFHVLELNTLPGLTSVSLLPDAAKAAGDRILEQAAGGDDAPFEDQARTGEPASSTPGL